MKKIFSMILLCAMLILGGCSEDTTTTFDSNGFVSEISTLTLDDELIEIPESMAETFYDLTTDGIASYTLYGSGTRATASEIMIVEIAEGGNADDISTMLSARKDDLTVEYQDYIPAEVDRIEDSVIQTRGNHVILAITGYNDSVIELLDKYTVEE